MSHAIGRLAIALALVMPLAVAGAGPGHRRVVRYDPGVRPARGRRSLADILGSVSPAESIALSMHTLERRRAPIAFVGPTWGDWPVRGISRSNSAMTDFPRLLE
ncbi:MAG: hypothetical protein MZV70_05605 [Desulfobacterales bacterium]|nr:hypothetical protein [Desulfobacterales bacterium]